MTVQYKGWDPDEAVKSYLARINEHKKTYETIDTSAGPFVKIYNGSSLAPSPSCSEDLRADPCSVGERLVINNIQGYLQSRIVLDRKSVV